MSGLKPSARRSPSDAVQASRADRELSPGERIERERQRKRREWKRRRVWAGLLFGLGALVGVSHVVEHLGAFTLISSGVDDLVAGYPMALALIIAGAIKLGPR